MKSKVSRRRRNEATVTRIQETMVVKPHELRRTRRHLSTEEEYALPTTTQRVRMRGNNLAQGTRSGDRSEYANPTTPAGSGHSAVLVPAGLRRNVHARSPSHVRQVALNSRSHVAAVLTRYPTY